LNSKGFSLLETVIFIILAALAIPIFYLTTAPMIKDMMTPTSYIKARFVAERKMEEFMAYTFEDPRLGVASPAYTVPCYTDYTDYDCKMAINYYTLTLGTSAVLYTTSTPTAYKQIDVTVRGPQDITYRAVSGVTARQ
jgi:hypothetical protein